MSTPLAVTLIVLLDLALIGLLAYVMSRAARLSPHRAARTVPATAGAAAASAEDADFAVRQLRPAPRRHSRTYQAPTPSSTHTGSTSDRIEPARKSAARIKAVRSL